jgi:HNH endonuclease
METEFDDVTVWIAFNRSKGQCECLLAYCPKGHFGRCIERFTLEQRATSDGRGYQAHHRVEVQDGGKGTPDNCEILCVDCHKGRHSGLNSILQSLIGRTKP